MDKNLKTIATGFLELVASGKIDEAYNLYVDKTFKHHNAWYRGDATSLKDGMKENAIQNPHKSLDIQRTLEDGELVAVHSWVRQHPGDNGASVVHIFRFLNNKIIELWDIGMPIPETIENENGIF